MVAVPQSWKRPLVDSVLLPAHAVATGCAIYAVEEIEHDGPSTEERLTVCATVCDGVGQVRHQTSQILSAGIGRISFLYRSGEIPVGGATGDMPPTFIPPCGQSEQRTKQAMLTNQTENSITYTLIRAGDGGGDVNQVPLVVELQRVDVCPDFLDLYCASASGP